MKGRKINKLLHLFLMLLIIQACSNQSSQLSAEERTTIVDSVNTMLNNYYDDIRKEGLLAEFNYLDSSDQFFWVPPGYRSALSYDSVAAILRRNALALKSVDNTLETSRVIPLDHDLAIYTITLRSVVTDTAGHVFTSSLIESGTVVKRADGWKLLSGQTAVVD